MPYENLHLSNFRHTGGKQNIFCKPACSQMEAKGHSWASPAQSLFSNSPIRAATTMKEGQACGGQREARSAKLMGCHSIWKKTSWVGNKWTYLTDFKFLGEDRAGALYLCVSSKAPCSARLEQMPNQNWLNGGTVPRALCGCVVDLLKTQLKILLIREALAY